MTASTRSRMIRLRGQPEQEIAQEQHQVLEQRDGQHAAAQQLDDAILQPVVEGRLRVVADGEPLREIELLALIEFKRGRPCEAQKHVEYEVGRQQQIDGARMSGQAIDHLSRA